jgi:hypothetical protein
MNSPRDVIKRIFNPCVLTETTFHDVASTIALVHTRGTGAAL